jgi:hypothetical protein
LVRGERAVDVGFGSLDVSVGGGCPHLQQSVRITMIWETWDIPCVRSWRSSCQSCKEEGRAGRTGVGSTCRGPDDQFMLQCSTPAIPDLPQMNGCLE